MPDRISIIVPTFNRKEMLIRLLDSFSGLRSPVPLEIIVVDDCSDDEIWDVVESWKKTSGVSSVIYLKLDTRSGPARARNAGIAASTGNFIAFTDSDCVADPAWIEQLYENLARSPAEVAGFGGKVLPIRNDLYSRYFTLFRVLEPATHLRSLVGANCMFRKEPVVDAGLFDDYFDQPGGEEPSLCMKLWIRGFRFGFTEDAVVFHEYRNTPGAFIRTFLNYGRGEKILFESRLQDYLRYADYPEKMNNAVTWKRNGVSALFFLLQSGVHVLHQIRFIRKEPFTPWEKIQISLLSAIHHTCYHIGRGTFFYALNKSVARFLLGHPGVLVVSGESDCHESVLEITGDTIPERMVPGQTKRATITVKNISIDHWISGEFHILLRSSETDELFFRSKAEYRMLISPGAEIVYGFSITSPRKEYPWSFHLEIEDPSGRSLVRMLEKNIDIYSDSPPVTNTPENVVL